MFKPPPYAFSRIAWATQAILASSYAALNIWLDGKNGLLNSPWIWASDISSGILFTISFAWVAPMAWQISELNPRLQTWPRRFFIAALINLFATNITGLINISLRIHAIPKFSQAAPTLLSTSLYFAPPMVALGGFMWAYQKSKADQEAIKSEAMAAQLRALQGQLQPHALYNALNGLAELIEENPQQASQMVKTLSQLLKQIQESVESITIPIHSELDILRNYLQLESIRYGERLHIQWCPLPEIQTYSIPPLALQGLAENALKHGIWPEAKGGILKILIHQGNQKLHLEIHNSGKAPRESSKGTGLENFKNRLRLIYGDNATFSLHRHDEWTIAAIVLPLSQ